MTRERKERKDREQLLYQVHIVLLWSFLLALTVYPLNKTYSFRHFFFSRNNSGTSPCVIQISGSKC